MATQYVDLAFPFRGLTQGASDEAVPEGFTLGPFRNVRPRDWKYGGKRRGATRPGCRKLMTSSVSSGAQVQALATVRTVENTGASAVGALVFQDQFTRSNTSAGALGDFDADTNADWYVAVHASGTSIAGNSTGSVSNNASWSKAYAAVYTTEDAAKVLSNVVVDARNDNTTSGTGSLSACYCIPTATTEPTDNYALTFDITTKSSLANTEFHAGFFCFGDNTQIAAAGTDEAFIIGVRGYTGVTGNFNGKLVPICGFNSTTSDYDDLKNMTPTGTGNTNWPAYTAGPWYPATSGTAAVIYPNIQPSTTYTLELRVNGVRVEFLIDGVRVAVFQDITLKSGGGSTVASASQTQFGIWFNNVGAGARAAIASIDNFRCYRAGVNAPETMVRIISIAGGDVMVGSEMTGLSAGTNATDAYSEEAEVTIVVGPGPGAASSGGVQYAYLLDGSSWNKVDVATGLVSAHTATAGSLPAGTITSQKPRYGIAWDGSLVWYGIVGAPDTFGVTRSLNWGDFNVTPSVGDRDGTEAFEQQIGEAISSIFPTGDRRLILSSQNALYVMTDRLPLGGSIYQLTSRTGVLSPWAWSVDQFGNAHIIHTSGHWIVPRGGGDPTPVSRGRMDEFFRSIDPNAYRVECVWSNRQDGMHIFMTNRASPSSATNHLFWDRAEDCYAIDTMPGGMNPTAAAIYTDTDGRERVIFGSTDGYLRVVDAQATSDDSVAIDGVAEYPPLTRGGLDRVALRGLEVRAGTESDAMTIGVRRALTVAGLESAAPSATASIAAGQVLRRMSLGVGGSAVGVRLSGSRFSVERVRAMIESGGPVYAQS